MQGRKARRKKRGLGSTASSSASPSVTSQPLTPLQHYLFLLLALAMCPPSPCTLSYHACSPFPKARHTAATMMNEKSSRSHAVFTLTLTQAYYFEATKSTGEKVRSISHKKIFGRTVLPKGLLCLDTFFLILFWLARLGLGAFDVPNLPLLTFACFSVFCHDRSAELAW